MRTNDNNATTYTAESFGGARRRTYTGKNAQRDALAYAWTLARVTNLAGVVRDVNGVCVSYVETNGDVRAASPSSLHNI